MASENECPEATTVVVEGVHYQCPPPDSLLRELGSQVQDLSPEEASYILAFVQKRGFREALLQVERLIVQLM